MRQGEQRSPVAEHARPGEVRTWSRGGWERSGRAGGLQGGQRPEAPDRRTAWRRGRVPLHGAFPLASYPAPPHAAVPVQMTGHWPPHFVPGDLNILPQGWATSI